MASFLVKAGEKDFLWRRFRGDDLILKLGKVVTDGTGSYLLKSTRPDQMIVRGSRHGEVYTYQNCRLVTFSDASGTYSFSYNAERLTRIERAGAECIFALDPPVASNRWVASVGMRRFEVAYDGTTITELFDPARSRRYRFHYHDGLVDHFTSPEGDRAFEWGLPSFQDHFRPATLPQPVVVHDGALQYRLLLSAGKMRGIAVDESGQLRALGPTTCACIP